MLEVRALVVGVHVHRSAYLKIKGGIDQYVRNPSAVVLDLGSRLSHKGGYCHRSLLDSATTYIGVDVIGGPNVDMQMPDPHTIPLGNASVDVVLCSQLLPHVPFPWLLMAEIERVLRPDGIALLAAASRGHVHGSFDGWRYYPGAMEALADFAELELVETKADFPPRLEGGNRYDYGALGDSEYWGDCYAVMRKVGRSSEMGLQLNSLMRHHAGIDAGDLAKRSELDARWSKLTHARSETDLLTVYVPGYDYPIFARPRSSDLLMFNQVLSRGDYHVALPVEDPQLILDIGANAGYAAVDFHLRYPTAKIISVEPEPSSVQMIERTTAGIPNIEIHAAGIWDKKCYLGIRNKDAHKMSIQMEELDAPRPDAIPAVTINDLLAESGCDWIDIAKIDIEGGEVELFRRNTEWIDKTTVMIVELHDRFKKGCREAVEGAIARSNSEFDEFTKGENTYWVRRNG